MTRDEQYQYVTEHYATESYATMGDATLLAFTDVQYMCDRLKRDGKLPPGPKTPVRAGPSTDPSDHQRSHTNRNVDYWMPLSQARVLAGMADEARHKRTPHHDRP